MAYECMACGKAVILSEIEGLWDRDLMVHGKSCLLVPCGSPEALRIEVRNLLSNLDRAGEIGRAARHIVEEHLNLDAMAAGMMRLIRS